MLREDSHKLLVKKKEEYNRQLAEKTRLEGTITALRAVTFIAGFCLIAIGLSEDNMLRIICDRRCFCGSDETAVKPMKIRSAKPDDAARLLEIYAFSVENTAI